MFTMSNNTRQQRIANKQLFISCIVPVHNEQVIITEFITALQTQLQALSPYFEIIIIDDGSQDDSALQVMQHPKQEHLKLISFSRNFGKEIALTAGLEHSTGEVVILMDADFQHPIELIPVFIQNWAVGYEMVYGVRNDRADESFMKRHFADLFYKLMASITRISIPKNAGDFRLLDRKVVDALISIQERGRFMKGLYAWVGFKSLAIPFDVPKRRAGKTSWGLHHLAELAITGITSFSNVPLRVWSVVGICVSFISFLYALYIITITLIFGSTVPGFATILVAVIFFGGIQLLSIGIMGEYIARIFNEVKQRPKYIIARKIGFENNLK